MTKAVLERTEEEFLIHVETSHLITEGDTPVNHFSEKQQRLLVEPLYTSWQGLGDNRSFLATANVSLFMINQNPAIVPDVLLSLDVVMPDDWWKVEGRSHTLWELGKTPDCAGVCRTSSTPSATVGRSHLCRQYPHVATAIRTL